jgi:hypothetical protein
MVPVIIFFILASALPLAYYLYYIFVFVEGSG